MSAKDIDDLKRKVHYIDRGVTPFLNVQIMKLYKLNSDLISKVKELENKVASLSNDNLVNNNLVNESKQEDKVPQKKNKVTKKTEVTNDIRTITLE